MLRFASMLLALGASILVISPIAANAQDRARIDSLVTHYQQADAPGVSLAVSIDGRVVFERWTGQADVARRVPIDGDTQFEIASVSKQFTAFAIMMLVSEGKIALDDSVRTWIPELEPVPVSVTIWHLLNHTGGLREVNSLLQLTGQWESSPVTQQRALDLILRQHGGNFPAGQREEYSNTGYQLLAEIVTRVSGQPFPEFLSTRIFQPLGMDDTMVRTAADQVIHDLATSYEPNGDGFARANLLAANYGSTGIVSTPRDLLRWAQVFETGEIGGPAVISAMAARSQLADARRAIAANGQEYRNFRGLDTWSHGGSTGGFRSFLLRIPEARMAIAVMGNRSDFLKAAFAFDIAEAFLVDRMEPLPAASFVPETGAELDRYVGDYSLFAGIVFSLRRDGDQLTFATFGKDDASPLPQLAKGVFLLNPKREIRIEFHDFSDGRATQMRWQVSQDGFIPAPRVAMQPVPRTPLNLGELEGAYFNDALQQVVRLFAIDGALWLRTGDGNRIPLNRYQHDLFNAEGPGSVQRVAISRDGTKGVSGIIVSAVMAENLEYRKIDHD